MTKRPSDDFQINDRDKTAEYDFGDDDDAAFGNDNNTDEKPSGERAPLTETVSAEAVTSETEHETSEPDIAENYDDSDFVMDDAEDVIDEDAEREFAEYEDDLHDPLADEDPYPTTEEIYDPAADADALNNSVKTKKKNDFVFYGILGVIGIGALAAAYFMTMGSEKPVIQNILNSAPEQTAEAPAGDMQVPNEPNSPAASPAEPKPDVIGIQGAQSTLNNDTMEPLPTQVPDIPPGEIAAPSAVAPTPATAPAVAPIGAVQPLVPQPVATTTTVSTTTQAPLPAQVPPEVKAQLDAQQQVINNLQAQMEAQEKVMQKVQEQAALAMAQPAKVATVTAPPSTSKDPALNDVATDLNVRITEVNAKLAQISSTMADMQKTATKLDKQNIDLASKTKEIQDKLGTQSTKITELANKEPAPSNDKASLEQLKVGVAQMEKKLSLLTQTQAALKDEQAKLATRATVQQPVAVIPPMPSAAPAATRTVTTTQRTETVEVPAQPQNVLKTLTDTPMPTAEPRSPKTRAAAGITTTDVRNTWVLRAATPTMAWLSPRPGSAELKRVAPGDTVPGIGQVLEIRQEMGKWTVIGTTGSIR